MILMLILICQYFSNSFQNINLFKIFQVHLQTQQEKVPGGQMALKIVRTQGFLALYNGLSASLLRQVTYSTTRFAIYEVIPRQDNFFNDTKI